MTWLFRHADQHVCKKPELHHARPGDLWRCDECMVIWVVREDQRDGMYMILSGDDDLRKKGIER